MMTTTMTGPLLAFLGTYLVHSTVLFGAAWLLGAYVVRGEAWRETLWKAALVGGLVTSAAAQVSPWTSLRVSLPAYEIAEAGGAAAAAPMLEDDRATLTGDIGADAGVGAAVDAGREIDASPAAVAAVSAPAVEEAVADVRRTLSWPTFILTAWASISLLLLGRLAWRRARLARVLRERKPVTAVGLPEMLASLRRTAGVWTPVRLTSTPAIASPLALGSREICVPERFVTALGPAEQRVALAHELGHLARRDPAWLLGAMLLECVFFFQPLQRVARRGLRESAEYLADSWAVRLAGGRLSLARCLAEVAAWVSTSEAPVPAEMVAMAEGGSPLLNRVSRLLEREPEQEPRRVLRIATAVAVIAVAAAFAPVIGSGRALVASQQFVDVTMWPERGALSDGLRWADGAARAAGAEVYWVAWATPSRVPVGREESTDSEPWRSSDMRYNRDIARTLGVTHELANSGEYQPAIMLARFVSDGSEARLDRLAMRAGGGGPDVRGHVYWLGNQPAAGSFAWLSGVYADAQDPRVREAVVEAVAVHDVADAPRFLQSVIESRAGRNLTEQAVEGLAWDPSDETLTLLTALAHDDSDSLIGAEAAETLGELEHPAAGDALQSVMRGARDRRVRHEALETLTERGDTALAALLLEIALNDSDPSMRREAVELMQELPASIAVPLLQRVIAESRDDEAVHQAIESLAEIGTADAFAAVEAVLEHPASDVRREAMEVLAEERGTFEDGETLLQIALHDDSPDNRREAVEYMAELPPQEAVKLLRRVVFESGDGTAERQAAESLGEVGTMEALAVLDEIIARNPGEDASFQAVESIAENFARDLVVPRLTKIAREHPSRRVRREALDHLSELGGGP